MANEKPDRVLEEVKNLAPFEQRRVRDAIDDLLGKALSDDESLQRDLLEAGLLSEIKAPVSLPRPGRKLIECKGRPLSEIAVEECR
jgi:hypothetical protein